MKRSLKNKKILITCGPTWIPIDDMRVISNKSTGELGQLLAMDLNKKGAKVTLLEGPVAQAMSLNKIKVVKFTFYDEFLRTFKAYVKKKYDCVIHAAAVSDYKLKKPFKSKVGSNLKQFKLDLVPTIKVINLVKKLNKDTKLVGFKLESKMTRTIAKAKANELIENTDCDLVVANNTTDKKYSGYIINKEAKVLTHASSRKSMSSAIVKAIERII